jgi:hypothetical protein
MKRAEAQFRKEWASIRPVLMQFTYDNTVSLWRVTLRPRGDSIPLPRVMHFGDAESRAVRLQFNGRLGFRTHGGDALHRRSGAG